MLWALDRAEDVLRWYREFIAQRPGGSEWLLRLPDRAGDGAIPGASLEREDVRHRLGLHAATRQMRRLPPSAPSSVRRPSIGWGRSPTRPSTACSTGSTRRATSGTGRPTSSRRSRTRPSPSTSNTARSCRPGSRPCTSTRSMAWPDGWPRTPRPGTTATPSGAWSSSGSVPIRLITTHMIAWARTTGEELHPFSAGGAYVNMMMDASDEGSRPGARLLPRPLRAPGEDQGPVRPAQPLPRQPEHQAGLIATQAIATPGNIMRPGPETRDLLPVFY